MPKIQEGSKVWIGPTFYFLVILLSLGNPVSASGKALRQYQGIPPHFFHFSFTVRTNRASTSDPQSALMMGSILFEGSKMTDALIYVSSQTELYDALKSATGGETIVLAAGNYGDLNFRDLNFTDTVTIQSYDPDVPAIFGRANMYNCSNLSFDGISFVFEPDVNTVEWSTAFRIANSDNITVVNSQFLGGVSVAGVDEDAEPGSQVTYGIIGHPIGVAASLYDSDHITFENNFIDSFARGFSATNVDNLSLLTNEIQDFRHSLLSGTGLNNLNVNNNYAHDPNPWKPGGLGDHSDFVHLWNSSPAGDALRDITIEGNRFIQADGSGIMGIFLAGIKDTVSYENVNILDNVILSDHRQGILLEGVSNSAVRNNSLLAPDSTVGGNITLISRGATTGLYVVDNVFSSKPDLSSLLESVDNNEIEQNNMTIQYLEASAEGHFATYFIENFDPTTNEQHIFFIGTNLDGQFGSSLLQFPLSEEGILPAIQVKSLMNGLVFDASHTVLDDYLLTFGEVEFLWTFDDGVTLTGRQVFRESINPGQHSVVLSVGNEILGFNSIGSNFGVREPEFLSFNGETGLFELHRYGEVDTILDPGITTGPTESEGFSLRLGGEGVAASIAKEYMQPFFRNNDFLISFSIQEGANNSFGEIFRIHESLRAEVTETGRLKFSVTGDSGSQIDILSEESVLYDGKIHQVELKFSNGIISLSIDELNHSNVEFFDLTPALKWWGLSFGNPWGAKNFEGDIYAFSFSAEKEMYPNHEGVLEDLQIQTSSIDDVLSSSSIEETTLFTDLIAAGTYDLSGEAHFVSSDGSMQLVLDGKNDSMLISHDSYSKPLNKLGIEVDFQLLNESVQDQTLLYLKDTLKLAVDTNSVSVSIGPNKKGLPEAYFEVGNLDLQGARQHRLELSFDSETSRFQMLLDDNVILDETGVSFDYNDTATSRPLWHSDWTLGAGGRRDLDFSGLITDFNLSDDFTLVNI